MHSVNSRMLCDSTLTVSCVVIEWWFKKQNVRRTHSKTCVILISLKNSRRSLPSSTLSQRFRPPSVVKLQASVSHLLSAAVDRPTARVCVNCLFQPANIGVARILSGGALVSQKSWRPFFSRRPQKTVYNY